MAVQYQPVVGDWYMSATGETFEVVAYDPEEESVEIQNFDGSLDELELETWLEVSLEPIEPPEDFSGSLDITREDYGDDTLGRHPNNPLDDLDL
jgi:hypothetical protein